MKLFSRSKAISRRVIPRADASPPHYSYSGTDQPLRSGARSGPSRSLSGHWRRLPTMMALIIIAGSLLFSMTVSSQPSVSLVEGQRPLYRSLDEYSSAAATILKEKIAYKTKFTINTKEVEETLLTKYPELAAVAIRLPLVGRRPTLILEQRLPVLILTTKAKSFVLDGNGSAVGELQSLAVEAREGLPSVLDHSGLELAVGDQAVTSETVTFIQEVLAQLEGQNLKVRQLTLPPLANQLDITLDDVDYYIKTDISGDAALQIGTYLAVRDKLQKDRVVPKEYIDVRVEERAFYK